MSYKIILTISAVFALALPVFSTRPASAAEEMVFVTGGCFDMRTYGQAAQPMAARGAVDDVGADARPMREACVEDFYISRREVTVGEYRAFTANTGYRTEAENGDGCMRRVNGLWSRDSNASWRNPGYEQTDSSPVVCIGWSDAVEYVKWKREKTGFYYKIPTESEWERAARIGGIYSMRGAARAEASSDGRLYTAPAPGRVADSIGLFDMAGGVRELVLAWADDAEEGPVSRPVHAARGGTRGSDGSDAGSVGSVAEDERGGVADLGLRVIIVSVDE